MAEDTGQYNNQLSRNHPNSEIDDTRPKTPEDKESKKTLISSSPDSAVFLSDQEEEHFYQNTNYPSYKSEDITSSQADNKPINSCCCKPDPMFYQCNTLDTRRMSLLKSLSQDSEYSLDTSFFNAEEFLEDLGFAGSEYPTIPDRFMPSLIEKISTCPETEMGSLNDRILLSIGRFRRKVGKRRLFRNLSMGRDTSHQHKKCHLCPKSLDNGFPLIRSNTGPSRFSEERLPLLNTRNQRLTSEPADHVLDSQVVCESPVAICISEASDINPTVGSVINSSCCALQSSNNQSILNQAQIQVTESNSDLTTGNCHSQNLIAYSVMDKSKSYIDGSHFDSVIDSWQNLTIADGLHIDQSRVTSNVSNDAIEGFQPQNLVSPIILSEIAHRTESDLSKSNIDNNNSDSITESELLFKNERVGLLHSANSINCAKVNISSNSCDSEHLNKSDSNYTFIERSNGNNIFSFALNEQDLHPNISNSSLDKSVKSNSDVILKQGLDESGLIQSNKNVNDILDLGNSLKHSDNLKTHPPDQNSKELNSFSENHSVPVNQTFDIIANNQQKKEDPISHVCDGRVLRKSSTLNESTNDSKMTTPQRRMSLAQCTDFTSKKSSLWNFPSKYSMSCNKSFEESSEDTSHFLTSELKLNNHSTSDVNNIFKSTPVSLPDDKLRSPDIIKFLSGVPALEISSKHERARSDSLTNFMSSMLHDGGEPSLNNQIDSGLSSSLHTDNAKESLSVKPKRNLSEVSCNKYGSDIRSDGEDNKSANSIDKHLFAKVSNAQAENIFENSIESENKYHSKEKNQNVNSQRKRPRLRRMSTSLEISLPEGENSCESSKSISESKNSYDNTNVFSIERNSFPTCSYGSLKEKFSVNFVNLSNGNFSNLVSAKHKARHSRTYDHLSHRISRRSQFPVDKKRNRGDRRTVSKTRSKEIYYTLNNTKRYSDTSNYEFFNSSKVDSPTKLIDVLQQARAAHNISNFKCDLQPKTSLDVTRDLKENSYANACSNSTAPFPQKYVNLLENTFLSSESQLNYTKDFKITKERVSSTDYNHQFKISHPSGNKTLSNTELNNFSFCRADTGGRYKKRLDGCYESFDDDTWNFDCSHIHDDVFRSRLSSDRNRHNEHFEAGVASYDPMYNYPNALKGISREGREVSNTKTSKNLLESKFRFKSVDRMSVDDKYNDTKLTESKSKPSLDNIYNVRSKSFEHLRDILSRKSKSKDNERSISHIQSSNILEHSNGYNSSFQASRVLPEFFSYTRPKKSELLNHVPILKNKDEIKETNQTHTNQYVNRATFNYDTQEEKCTMPTRMLRHQLTKSVSKTAKMTSQNMKREEMLEKKMRIFSKLLSNLGRVFFIPEGEVPNVDKNTKVDNNTSGSKSENNFISSDKDYISDIDMKQQKTFATEALEYLLRLADLKKGFERHSVSSGMSDNAIDRKSDDTIEVRSYENGVYMMINIDDGMKQANPKIYYSSVYMDVNTEGSSRGNDFVKKFEDVPKAAEDICFGSNIFDDGGKRKLFLPENPHRGASKELEELQMVIRKAKESRVSASRELHLLQELLLGINSSQQKNFADSKNSDKLSGTMSTETESTNEMHVLTDAENLQALSDLRKKSRGDILEDSFFREEIKKVRQENDLEWQERLNRMESRLEHQEQELNRVQEENRQLKLRMELGSERQSPACRSGKSRGLHNGHGLTNGHSDAEDDHSGSKPSSPTVSMRKDCERLQEQLASAEEKSDELNIQLNQKLIELNKLQLTLSKQTKEMIELEKSYLQLQCRLRRGMSKPCLSRLCSRTLSFGIKNILPRSSPPQSPMPGI